MTEDISVRREEANVRAARAMVTADPVWVDVRPAGEAIPGMREDLILHSGPPIAWERMLDGQQGAMICAALFEGLADDAADAEERFAAGEIDLDPAHDHHATGPGSGAVSASMPVFVVRDAHSGVTGYCTIAELLMVFGCYDADAVAGVERLRDDIGPALGAAVDELDGLRIGPLLAKSLLMGDEGHDRTTAGSHLLASRVGPAMLRAGLDPERVAGVLEYVAETELFFFTFLNMAASKAVTRAADGHEHSSLVTVLAGNGVDYGIRVSGLDEPWFTGPAPVLRGEFFDEYGQADAAALQGDSVVTETAGLGGFSLPAAPVHVRDTGGTMAQAERAAERMRTITVTENPTLRIPALEFRGTPTGVDLHAVVEEGITPFHAAGLGHRERGEGFIGLGLGHAPMSPFAKAHRAYEERYGG
jgi:hypothetical protein